MTIVDVLRVDPNEPEIESYRFTIAMISIGCIKLVLLDIPAFILSIMEDVKMFKYRQKKRAS